MEIRYKYECVVREVTKTQAQTLVNKYHYLGEKKFLYSKAYGLFHSEQLLGVAVFSPVTGISALASWFGLNNQEGEGLYELIRLVMAPEHNGKNGTSFLLGRALRLLKQTKARGVVSLADSERHIGFIYQACNFKYYGTTDKKTDFYRWDNKLNPRGSTRNVRGVWLERSVKNRYFFSFGKLQPVLEQKPYPKEVGVKTKCCEGTLKVYDKRFDTYYLCPKCNITDNKVLQVVTKVDKP